MDCHQQHEASEILSAAPVANDAVARVRSNERDLPLLLQEINHRIRNLLAMIEAVVGQTQSTNVEEYRARVMARICELGDFYEVLSRLDEGKIDLAQLLEQTIRPCCATGARVVANGSAVCLGPRLALSLHLVVHELANNAWKYGALSSRRGIVNVAWEIRQSGDGARKLAIVWSEDGGPRVKQPRRRGFGSRLITKALKEYGEVRLDFRPTGVTCCALIDLDQNMETWRTGPSKNATKASAPAAVDRAELS